MEEKPQKPDFDVIEEKDAAGGGANGGVGKKADKSNESESWDFEPIPNKKRNENNANNANPAIQGGGTPGKPDGANENNGAQFFNEPVQQ